MKFKIEKDKVGLFSVILEDVNTEGLIDEIKTMKYKNPKMLTQKINERADLIEDRSDREELRKIIAELSQGDVFQLTDVNKKPEVVYESIPNDVNLDFIRLVAFNIQKTYVHKNNTPPELKLDDDNEFKIKLEGKYKSRELNLLHKLHREMVRYTGTNRYIDSDGKVISKPGTNWYGLRQALLDKIKEDLKTLGDAKDFNKEKIFSASSFLSSDKEETDKNKAYQAIMGAYNELVKPEKSNTLKK